MTDWHIDNAYSQHIDRAHQDRADALARAGHRLVTGVTRIAGGVVAVLRQWRDRRRAARSLLSLDDRMLKNIGLTRGDIWAAVHGELPDRGIESAPAPAPAADIALSPHAIGGCNDNQRPRRAA
ncbi:MAG: DUF1127 domain-containing protein [Dongiaceae bacterium]